MAIKYVSTEPATLERANALLHERNCLSLRLPIWVRWFRTYDNPHGGGSFGKSKEYCTVELVGVTHKRLKVKDHGTVSAVDPKNCSFARRIEI